MPSHEDAGAKGRAQGFETRLNRICARYGITREKYLSLTDSQKVEYRIKFGTANPYRHRDGTPVKRTQLTKNPEEIRAEAQALAVLAERADVSEEDYQRWQNALPTYYKSKANAKIQYTMGEVSLLAETAAEELMKNKIPFVPEMHDNLGLSFLLAAVRTAMKRLPRNRRRAIEGRQQIGTPLLRQLKLALRREAKKAPPEPMPKPAPAPAAPASADIIQLPGSKSAPEPIIEHDEPAHHPLKDVSNEALLATLLGRLFKGLERTKEAVSDPRVQLLEQEMKAHKEYTDMLVTDLEELRNRFNQFVAGAAQMTMAPIEEAAPAQANVRVAIIGCLKVQFDRVVQRAAELNLPVKIQFIHLDADKNPSPFSADFCLCMKWLSHKWWAQIKERISQRDHRPFLSGGESTAVSQLAVWFMPDEFPHQG